MYESLYYYLSNLNIFVIHRVSTDILMDKVSFFEQADNNDNSLLGSFLKQPNLDLKDVLGMMVDMLMAAIDTVNKYCIIIF